MGCLIIVLVHAANIYDGHAGRKVLSALFSLVDTVKKILADGAYKGEEFNQWVKEQFDCVFEVVEKKKRVKVFKFYRSDGLWNEPLLGSVDSDD